jgi:DNA-binding IclR family transcriptional regulator
VAEISKTADQALATLLELSENGPMTAAELSRSLGLNRTVIHRLLTTLHRRGFIIRQHGGYVPGALLVRMAARVQPELRAAAAAHMADLAEDIGETIVLHVADGNDAVVLEQVVGTAHVVRVQHRIGSRHSLAVAASGRALLAFMEEASAERVIAASSGGDLLRTQLEGVRQLGYAISHDELQNDVYGLAVPVREDQIALASLGILVPTTRATAIVEHLPKLLGAADNVARSLFSGADLVPTA